ncbi:hypothetical protein P152DRAFT_458506 [Eremomyces bilateralis CBS 781.70]|uniref:Uncharacterized protein n=1 Tax=Eremomyces bilateralis CBS 781.70 TaxID=1392243 RepID=A0A6G1G3L0_9PEZI|nr:uncharacterized protein P152DRAFT_458506 [Eremomyces bilateralis CBS 781.70]KAF1812695.1 hypothetical protein P152DRAFT_458506 [Eremomyces bilateralis CBS 781.70]
MARRTTMKPSLGKAQPKRDLDDPTGATSLPKRPKRSSTTLTKSKYFESEDAGEESTDSLSSEAKDEPGYEDDSAQSELSDEPEDSDFSEEIEAPSRNVRKGQSNKQPAAIKNARSKQDLGKSGAKTGLGPGTQVIMKKPKARDPGDTPYSNDIIHPNTMLFLRDLKQNNSRQWLKSNDPDYRTSWNDWLTYCESLTERIAEVDDTIPELPVKDLVFRIYRDVRFSKDQSPYKTAFSAAWSRTGRKGPYAAYYVEVSPGNSFVAGGLWMPEPGPLAALRRDVDRRPNRIKTVLRDARFRKEFLKGPPNDDKNIIKAFAAANTEGALKTKPKGYNNDHPDLELLRLRSYTVGKRIPDGDVNLDSMTELISSLVPFITYLNSVVMPDGVDEEEDSDDMDDEG